LINEKGKERVKLHTKTKQKHFAAHLLKGKLQRSIVAALG
jgi:hypothetical protein